MAKFFKRVLQVLLAFIAVVVIAVIGVVNFVNPNQFKGTLEKEVLAKTGFVLTVQGPIQWRWFPMLSLEFNDIAIQNLAPFSGQLLSAKAIQAECELLPVFLGKISLAVRVKGLDLALARNAKGQANWENLNQHLKEPDTNKTTTIKPNTTTKSANAASSLAITLNSLKVQEGKIAFTDQAKSSEYVLEHVNLSLDNLFKGLSGTITPFFLNFELISNHQTLGNIFFNTEWVLQKEKEQLNLQKMALKLQLPDGTKNLITGDAEIQQLLDTPIIKANLLANDLQFDKIKIDKIKTTITAQAGIITLAPIDIHIAKSQQNATLKLDMRASTPKIYLTQEAHDFEINDLLTLFGKKDKISGKTRFTINLSATGTDLQTLQNSLSGKAAIEINHGKFLGIDFMQLLKNSQSSIHGLVDALTHKISIDSLSLVKSELTKWKTDPNSTAFSPFNSLTATAAITNGVIQNPDLAINHSDYAISGTGTINLRANNVQYQTTLQLKNNPYPANDKAGTFLFQTPLHIQIQDNPKIQPDLSRYTNSALEFAQKELIGKAVQKTMGKAIQKVTGSDGVQDKLHKALGNILNTGQ